MKELTMSLIRVLICRVDDPSSEGLTKNRLYLDLDPAAAGEMASARCKGTGITRMGSDLYPIAVNFFTTGHEEAASSVIWQWFAINRFHFSLS
jgi:hypothetical protein